MIFLFYYYKALQNYKGSKQLLPASMKTFTSEQLFFLSFANVSH